MSSHMHLIIGSTGAKMEDILRDLKRHTAKALLEAIAEHNQESWKEWMLWMFERAGRRNPNNPKYQFWQQLNQLVELGRDELIDQKLNYLHRNPVEAGWVEEPEHYLYSSARNYAGMKGTGGR